MELPWWQERVVYQIYPRSFQDTNDDGIGDIQGIIHRLDYIESLGVGSIWLSPIFTSPMADFGYDISDYRGIDSIYGSLQDVEELIDQAHQRSLKVIFDLVLNHTSNKHPWFLDSRTSRNAEKANFYIWKDEIPNNWFGAFGGKGWTFDSTRGQYYYHSFLPEQPDLNWRDQNTVDAIFNEVSFWLEKGIDGFRLDVINLIIKDDKFRDNPKIFGTRPRPYDMQRHIFDRNRPESHAKIRSLRKLTDKYPQRMLVGEIMVESPGEPELAASFLGKTWDELHLTFDFSLINTPFSAQKWQKAAKRWYEAVGKNRCPTWVLNNHDVKRSISRFNGNEARARLAALFLLTQYGSIFLYYGEELGLVDSSVGKRDLQDPLGKRYWPFHKGRDGERGPMIWNVGVGHGFSNTTPWLPFASGGNRFAVENQELEPDSMLTFYKSLIELRNNDTVLLQGDYAFLSTSNSKILAYTRTSEEGKRLVLLNFSAKKQTLIVSGIQASEETCRVVFSTAPISSVPVLQENLFHLEGFQGVLLHVT